MNRNAVERLCDHVFFRTLLICCFSEHRETLMDHFLLNCTPQSVDESVYISVSPFGLCHLMAESDLLGFAGVVKSQSRPEDVKICG